MARGPLAARTGPWSLEEVAAGTLVRTPVTIENVGTAPWEENVVFSYHWLDDLGNALIWDGERTPLPPLQPGESATIDAQVRAPTPPGRYGLALDLVAEGVIWFSELGEALATVPVRVMPRRGVPLLDLPSFVEASEEFIERAAALHAEGYAVVAGSIAWGSPPGRRTPHALDPYRPGTGRNPSFAYPLICPSILVGVTLQRLDEIEGLPTFAAPSHETWIYDGRLTLVVDPRSHPQ